MAYNSKSISFEMDLQLLKIVRNYNYFCRFEVEKMSKLTCTWSDTIRPCQDMHLNFQNTFDERYRAQNVFGSLISTNLALSQISLRFGSLRYFGFYSSSKSLSILEIGNLTPGAFCCILWYGMIVSDQVQARFHLQTYCLVKSAKIMIISYRFKQLKMHFNKYRLRIVHLILLTSISVPHYQFCDIFSYNLFLNVNNWKSYSTSV